MKINKHGEHQPNYLNLGVGSRNWWEILSTKWPLM